MDEGQSMIDSKTGWLHERLGTLVLWALLIGFESAGQIASKVGGDQLGQMDFTLQWLLAVADNPGVWVAIACYIGAFFVWMLILRRSSLSLAFPSVHWCLSGYCWGHGWGWESRSACCTGWGWR
jgi:hypothetical protein